MTRTYVMQARAQAVEETRQRIIDAAIALYYERPGPDSSLDEIAARAGITVQTLLRHFGNRAALDEAAGAQARAQVLAERRATPGDAEGAVRALFDHYERAGRSVLVMLAQETIAGIPDLSAGRRTHRKWVEEVFAPQLAVVASRERGALVDELVVVTDVYTWKLLRLNLGMERGPAERRVRAMIAALVRARTEE
jgi:AcrR family transcriptional regulator